MTLVVFYGFSYFFLFLLSFLHYYLSVFPISCSLPYKIRYLFPFLFHTLSTISFFPVVCFSLLNISHFPLYLFFSIFTPSCHIFQPYPCPYALYTCISSSKLHQNLYLQSTRLLSFLFFNHFFSFSVSFYFVNYSLSLSLLYLIRFTMYFLLSNLFYPLEISIQDSPSQSNSYRYYHRCQCFFF